MDAAEWRERQKDFLAKVLARGKKRFVLERGTLWAISWVLLTNLFDGFIGHGAIDWWFFPISLVIAAVFGYAYGIMMWRHYEERLRKLSTSPQ